MKETVLPLIVFAPEVTLVTEESALVSSQLVSWISGTWRTKNAMTKMH